MDTLTNRKGFTFVEVCMSVLILSVVFGVAAGIMSYSRRETEKGFWVQQTITSLRNATRQIGIKMKEMSYPSTLVSKTNSTGATNKKVINFKEKREYDSGGRLRYLELNSSKAYEMYCAGNQGRVLPEANEKVLMIFPICESEKEYGSDYTPGKITWTRFVLRPDETFATYGRSSIFMQEFEDSYDTRGNALRAYSLDSPFDMSGAKLIREKELIKDVSGVEINSFDISSSRGQYVTKTGSKYSDFRAVRNIITFKIFCAHPKDAKINISDICSVTAGVEVYPL